MCLIIASPTGKRISDKILEEAARSNGDGAGLAWLQGGGIVRFKKGLTVEDVKKLLDGEAKGKAWVAHFRIATHGGVRPELTHPFTIDAEASVALEGEAPSVLFHNGTFQEWKQYLLQAAATSGTPLPEAPWSDSRALAFCCGVFGKHFLSIIDNQSRFLVFDAAAEEADRMMCWGNWYNFEVFKFSNQGTSAFYSSSYGGGSNANFPNRQALEEGEEKVESAAANTEESNKSSSETPNPSKDSHKSSTSTESRGGAGTGTNRPRSFRARENHDYWRHFDTSGVYVEADNEAAPSTK